MPRKREAGFTFIELLLALTLFAVIASGVYRTFYMGTQIWSKCNLMMKESHALRVLFNALSQDAVNSTVFYSDDPQETLWEKRQMRFATLENIYQDGKLDTELARVEYRFDPKKGALSRKYVPVSIGSDKKTVKETVFLQDLEDAIFEYSPAGNVPGTGSVWSETWTGEKNGDLPGGIRVRVRLKATRDMPGEQFEKVIIMPMVRFEKDGAHEPL